MSRKRVKKPPKLRKVKDRALRKPSPEAVYICPECKKEPPDWYFCTLSSEWICCDCGAVLNEDEADCLVSNYKPKREYD